MGYYVVNVRNSRGGATSRATHIMQSGSPDTPGVASAVVVGGVLGWGSGTKSTLCGLWAGRHVEVFQPAEASCRECRKRYQLAVAKEAALTPQQRAARADRQTLAQAVGCLFWIALAAFVIVWIVVYHH